MAIVHGIETMSHTPLFKGRTPIVKIVAVPVGATAISSVLVAGTIETVPTRRAKAARRCLCRWTGDCPCLVNSTTRHTSSTCTPPTPCALPTFRQPITIRQATAPRRRERPHHGAPTEPNRLHIIILHVVIIVIIPFYRQGRRGKQEKVQCDDSKDSYPILLYDKLDLVL